MRKRGSVVVHDIVSIHDLKTTCMVWFREREGMLHERFNERKKAVTKMYVSEHKKYRDEKGR